MSNEETKKDADLELEELPDEIVLTEEISGGDRRAYFLRRASGSERRELIGQLPKKLMEEVAGGDRRAYFLRRAQGTERRKLVAQLPKELMEEVAGGNRRTYFLRRAMGSKRRQAVGHVPKTQMADVVGGQATEKTFGVKGTKKVRPRGAVTPGGGFEPTRS